VNLARAALIGFVLYAAPAFAQRLGSGADVEISPWRVIGVTVFCLALGLFAIFAMRQRLIAAKWSLPFGLPQPSRRLQLVERIRLGPQSEICLVRLDAEEILLAFSAAGVQRLDQPASPAEVGKAL
jgi:flagellar biogenesis protein FliO